MGILDSIVEWIATQVMNLLDLITGSVLGALPMKVTRLGMRNASFLRCRLFPKERTKSNE